MPAIIQNLPTFNPFSFEQYISSPVPIKVSTFAFSDILSKLNEVIIMYEHSSSSSISGKHFIDVISRRGSALDYAVYMDVLNEYFDQLNESKHNYSSSFKNSVIKRMESFKQTISIIAENGINPSAEEYAEIFKEEE